MRWQQQQQNSTVVSGVADGVGENVLQHTLESDLRNYSEIPGHILILVGVK